MEYKDKKIKDLKKIINTLQEEYEELAEKSEKSIHFFDKLSNKTMQKVEEENEKLKDKNQFLKNEIDQLNHLRKMDLEFLGILVWGYGIEKNKYNSMDKRIYSNNTYRNHTYDWDMLMNYLVDDDVDEVFDRIESINSENIEKKKEKQRKELQLYDIKKQEKVSKKQEVVLYLTSDIIKKAKKGELNANKLKR